MKIKHIKQKDRECGAASLAMALGISLSRAKTVLKKSGWKFKVGVTRKDLLSALDYLEYDCKYSDGSYIKKHSKKLKNPAILMVESKNEKNGFHIIVIHKGKVYDPQEGNKGVKTYTHDSLKSVFKNALYIIEMKKRK